MIPKQVSTNLIAVFFVIVLVALTMFALGRESVAKQPQINTPAPGLIATIDPSLPTETPGAVVVFGTATPSIEDRVVTLEDTYTEKFWVILLDKGAPYIWPVILILFVVVFHRSLSELIARLASVADRVNIEIMGVKWSPNEVNDSVVEREILKALIFVAAADGEINEKELMYLKYSALKMVARLQKLPDEQKTKVLREAITIALQDGVIQHEELEILKQHASEFEIEHKALEDIIINTCISTGIDPPEKLRSRYQKAKHALQ